MPQKPIPYDLWIKFLKLKGFEFKREGKGDHVVWDNSKNPTLRPIIFRKGYKEIPADHIRTNLNTIGISMNDFLIEVGLKQTKSKVSGNRKQKRQQKGKKPR